jgi:DNA helicase-2/ATP-dependent DNA helicase PcrA
VIRTLIAGAKTTLAVGDLNQSIYGWRDADGTVLKRLGEQESAAVFHLRKSYRSKGLITRLANLICPDRKSKIEGHEDSGTLDVKCFSCEAEEVQAVISSLEGNCAILSRTNAYLEPFERELIRRGIPYKGAAFYRSIHIRALASFVKRVSGDHVEAASRAFLKNEDYSKIEKEDFKLALKVLQEQGSEAFLDLVEGASTEGEGVTLMTGHGAKGLEWDKVWVVGVSEGRIPHSKARDHQEESRLLYVMITRSREELHLSYVGNPSPLLPRELLEGKKE